MSIFLIEFAQLIIRYPIFGVFLLALALWACKDGLIRAAQGQNILKEYVLVDGEITQASEVEVSKKMGAPTYYYQDFTLTYVYEGEVYNKSYGYFQVQDSLGYSLGDTEELYVNPKEPDSAVISTRVSKDYTFALQPFCLFGIPGLLIIFIPKGKSEKK